MGSGESKPPPPPEPKQEFKRVWAQNTKISWNDENLKKLRKLILNPRQDNNGQIIKPKILIFGPTGMGKSSFCNGVVSAMEGKTNVSSYFAVGSTSGTFTKGFHGKKFNDMWMIDMGGIFESRSITDQNIKDIASGKVPFYAKLTDTLEVKDRKELMVPAPGKNDVSCVVIVLALGYEIPVEIKRQLRCIMDLAGEGAVSYRLILTHVDVADEKFKDPSKLPSVFDSQSIQDAVMNMAHETGIPSSSISVVRNYACEPETDLYSNTLFLHALEKVVSSAYDQFDKKEQQKMLQAEFE